MNENNDSINVYHIVLSEKNNTILLNMSKCLNYESVESILTDFVELYINDLLYKGTIDDNGVIEGLKANLDDDTE